MHVCVSMYACVCVSVSVHTCMYTQLTQRHCDISMCDRHTYIHTYTKGDIHVQYAYTHTYTKGDIHVRYGYTCASFQQMRAHLDIDPIEQFVVAHTHQRAPPGTNTPEEERVSE